MFLLSTYLKWRNSSVDRQLGSTTHLTARLPLLHSLSPSFTLFVPFHLSPTCYHQSQSQSPLCSHRVSLHTRRGDSFRPSTTNSSPPSLFSLTHCCLHVYLSSTSLASSPVPVANPSYLATSLSAGFSTRSSSRMRLPRLLSPLFSFLVYSSCLSLFGTGVDAYGILSPLSSHRIQSPRQAGKKRDPGSARLVSSLRLSAWPLSSSSSSKLLHRPPSLPYLSHTMSSPVCSVQSGSTLWDLSSLANSKYVFPPSLSWEQEEIIRDGADRLL